jgi:hypothetical protein
VRPWPVVRWGVYALTLLYALYYFANYAAPGNSVQYPLGWWGWFDQSQYLASTRNLLARNLAPDGHWYPLLYPVLAVPFVRYWSMHGFFFLDLICLFAAYAGFLSFARRVGVGSLAAVPIFLITTFAYASIGQTWVEPWTTTLSAALIWGLLACAARLLPDQDVWRGWHLLALGLLAGSLPLVRPTDAVLSAIVVLFVLLSGLRGRVLRVRHLGWLMLGGAMILLPYAALHLRIYGFHATPYMAGGKAIGFAFSRLGWKTYLLLIEPHPWYPQGEGLLARFPWLVFSLAEIVLIAVSRQRRQAQAALILLGSMIVVCWALYFAYVDLLPANLWRYNLVHYLKWSLPGLGLFAWLFMLRVWQSPRWQYGLTVAVIIGVLSIRVVPTPAAPDENAEMIQYAAPPQGFEKTLLHDWQFHDALGYLGPFGARAVPDSQGLRVLAQRRAVTGVLTWTDGSADLNGPAIRWAARIGLGYPCWLPPYPCQRLPPRS